MLRLLSLFAVTGAVISSGLAAAGIPSETNVKLIIAVTAVNFLLIMASTSDLRGRMPERKALLRAFGIALATAVIFHVVMRRPLIKPFTFDEVVCGVLLYGSLALAAIIRTPRPAAPKRST
jgi:hypothetical protein